MEITKLLLPTLSRREMYFGTNLNKQKFHKVCPYPVSLLFIHEKNMESIFLSFETLITLKASETSI